LRRLQRQPAVIEVGNALKADIERPGLKCREVPTMEISSLFDHLVGGREKHRWDGQAKRLGGLKIDHELVFGWCLDRQIGRFLAFEDTINISGSAWVIVN
jgi:hypothetical protein